MCNGEKYVYQKCHADSPMNSNCIQEFADELRSSKIINKIGPDLPLSLVLLFGQYCRSPLEWTFQAIAHRQVQLQLISLNFRIKRAFQVWASIKLFCSLANIGHMEESARVRFRRRCPKLNFFPCTLLTLIFSTGASCILCWIWK